MVRIDIAQRRSTRLRVKHEVSQSDKVLTEVLEVVVQAGGSEKQTPQLRAQLGYLRLSQALNLMQQELLTDAISLLKSWSPLDVKRPSTMERVVAFKINTNLGKILRYQGHFEESLACLKQTLEETRDDAMFKDSLTDLVCNFGDTLLDQGRPVDAQEVIETELEYLDKRKNSASSASSASQRLQLSLAECYIEQQLVHKAESSYLEQYEKLKSGTFAELRCTIGLARVAHLRSEWKVAQDNWVKALALVNTGFGLGANNNPYTALAILKSMHKALLESREYDTAAKTLDRVRDTEATCSPMGCKHWIPGFTTQWLATLRDSLKMDHLFFTSDRT